MGTFYDRVRANFGELIVKDLKSYCNVNKKLSSQRNRRIFLLECKRNQITPPFISKGIKKLWNIPQQITHDNARTMDTLTQQVTTKLHNSAIRDTNVTI